MHKKRLLVPAVVIVALFLYILFFTPFWNQFTYTSPDELKEYNVFKTGDKITEEELSHVPSGTKVFADIDGDGQNEIIFTPHSRDARIYIAEKEGENYKISWKSKSLCYSYEFLCSDTSYLDISDYDNDGELEIGATYNTAFITNDYYLYLINPATKKYELELEKFDWVYTDFPDGTYGFLVEGNEEWTEIYEQIGGYIPP